MHAARCASLCKRQARCCQYLFSSRLISRRTMVVFMVTLRPNQLSRVGVPDRSLNVTSVT